jgi:general secretion pathway protein K
MKQQRGVALVLVLWVITLLSVIAGNFALSMRGEAHIARNLLSAAQAQAQADTGIQRAWYELMKPPTELQRWMADGAVHELSLEGGVLRISIQDESGKIDINTVSEALLRGLFRSVGADEDAAVALADGVQDWRDSSKLKRLHGAKDEDYRAAGKDYGPANASFTTVDELLRVLGMTPELFRQLEPIVTVHTRQAGVNTAVAPRGALLAIPGVTPALADEYLALRKSLIAAGQKVPVFAGASIFASQPAGLTIYAVRSEAKMADGTVFVRQAVARLTQDPKRPVALLAWGEGESEQFSEQK